MTPEQQIADMQLRISKLEETIKLFVRTTDYNFIRPIRGGTNGLRLLTLPAEKLSFYGYTPVAQHAVINGPSTPGAVYSQAEMTTLQTGINDLTDVLQYYGLMAG